MSQENVEIVRRLYDALTEGDAAAVSSLYDPEVEWDFSRSPFATVFKQTVYRGHEGLRKFNRERYEEAWKDFEDRLEDLIEVDERVISVVNSGGHGRASGAKVARTHYGVWTFRQAKVVRVEWFGTRDEALEAAALPE